MGSVSNYLLGKVYRMVVAKLPTEEPKETTMKHLEVVNACKVSMSTANKILRALVVEGYLTVDIRPPKLTGVRFYRLGSTPPEQLTLLTKTKA